MHAYPAAIPEVLVLEPRIFTDARGFFFESFNAQTFAAATGLQRDFVQDNHTLSGKGVLRGLHYQIKQPQGKLVRVLEGEIFDVAVDLRKKSPTFGQWVGVLLSAENKKQLWIPEGFAHGLLCWVKKPKFSIKPPIFTRQSINALYAGMTLLLVYAGLSGKSLYLAHKTLQLTCFLKLKFLIKAIAA